MQVPTNDQVKHDDLKETAAAYLEALRQGKEFIADQKMDMIHSLEASTSEINEELLALLGTVGSGVYFNEDADPEEVVQLVEEHRARLKEIQDMTVQFKEYQALFGMQQDDFSNLELAERQVDGRYQVWKSLFDFTLNAQDWTMGAILGPDGEPRLHIETIRQQVDEYGTKAYKVGRCRTRPLPRIPLLRPGCRLADVQAEQGRPGGSSAQGDD